ncbi:hypothetical protein [Fusibacter sp. 3D3]|uniref:hypothetical protein n=1 Tax=Fusibacter sp. 3D3 TaxID=1048380 RepID=UPI0008537CA8|nr:hypothetical protein [Fusibacter sp. 3D3]GAU76163.1 hypothetical protein F3D3_0760 [Fusibacter sp. 3D3]
MRISSSDQQYYISQTQKQTTSGSQSYDASTLALANALFSTATYASDSDSSSSVDRIKSDMLSDPKVQMMKHKIKSIDEGESTKMETIKTAMDNVSESDLDAMSLEDKQALLASVDSALSGEEASTAEIEALSEDELTQILTDIQAQAQQMAQGPSGPGGPGGLGGPGGPGGPGGLGGASAVSDVEDDDDEISTLQTLLDALYAEDEDEDNTTTEASSSTNFASNFLQNYAISQYLSSSSVKTNPLFDISE